MSIFNSFISVFALVLTTYNIKIIEFTKKNFLKNWVIATLVVGFCSLKFEMLMIPMYFAIMMILLFLDNGKIVKNLVSILISILITILADTIQGTFFIEILNKDSHQVLNSNLTLISMQVSMLVIASVISFIIGFILKNLNFSFDKIDFNNKFAILIFVNIVITGLIFYINSMMIKFSNVENFIVFIDSILFSCYFFYTIVMTYIFVIHLKKELEFKNKKIEFENLQEYTSNLEALYNDMRKFRHDYVNILSSMKGYIEKKDLDGLDKFFNNKILHISEEISRKNYKLHTLQNINILELKGLLSSKVIRAQELGIDVFIDIMEPVESINMDLIDLCRSTGILLDNAIEAALLCEVPSLKLGIINKKNSILIVIINSCLKETPPIYKMFEKGFSTKGPDRGLGLNNVKEILGNYKNISLETTVKNQEFIQNLQISNN